MIHTHPFQHWLQDLSKEKKPQALKSWQEFQKAMIIRFDTKMSFDVAESQLKQTMKLSSETYGQHLLRFERARRSVPDRALSHAAIVSIYLKTLEPAVSLQVRLSHQREINDVSSNAETGNTPTLVDISQWAMDWQQVINDSAVPVPSRSAPVAHSPNFSAAATSPAPTAPMNGLGAGAYYSSRNRSPYYRQTGPTSAPNPVNPQPSVPRQPSLISPPRTGGQNQRVCYGCNQPGHLRANCPHRPMPSTTPAPRFLPRS